MNPSLNPFGRLNPFEEVQIPPRGSSKKFIEPLRKTTIKKNIYFLKGFIFPANTRARRAPD
jgi:hypothetical protein